MNWMNDCTSPLIPRKQENSRRNPPILLLNASNAGIIRIWCEGIFSAPYCGAPLFLIYIRTRLQPRGNA